MRDRSRDRRVRAGTEAPPSALRYIV